jgi:hypothetical protein
VTLLVLDAHGVTRLAQRSTRALALIESFRDAGLWPPLVLSVVLVECLTGTGTRDAKELRFLRTCDVREELPTSLAQSAARLRTRAKRGSAVDSLVVAAADPGGTVLTSDPGDLTALAAFATDVVVERA